MYKDKKIDSTACTMIGKSILENSKKWRQTSEFYLAQTTSLSFVLRSWHNSITIKPNPFITNTTSLSHSRGLPF